eukprot:jgi/Botrbrau1/14822/Bobra.168_3s0004.1
MPGLHAKSIMHAAALIIGATLALAGSRGDKSVQTTCRASEVSEGSRGERLTSTTGAAAPDLDSCALKCLETPQCGVFLYCNSTVACSAVGEGEVEKGCVLSQGPFSPSASQTQPSHPGVTLGICTEGSIEDATATTGGTATYRWATTSKNEESRTQGFLLGEAKQN